MKIKQSASGLYIILLLLSAALLTFRVGTIQAETKPILYVVPVKHSVEQGLFTFLQRAFEEAEQNEADAILLEIDTPGGEIQAAGEIGELIRNQETPVYSYVVDEAFSAGTYIALNSDKIIMAPGSAMGAAAPIDLAGNMADQKVISAWTKKMVSAAEMNGRDPAIAEAMVNPEQGKPLSLDPVQAQKVGYAEGIAENREEALKLLGYNHSTVFTIEPTTGEKVARLVTNPLVIPLLLTIGLAGIAIELLMPGFGVPGVVGLISLSLYFFGHFIAGFAEWLHILLFILGILLLLIEVVVPGFGIFGGLGIVSVLSGIVMAAYDTAYGSLSLGIAIVVTFIVSFIIIKYFGHRGVWNKFILRDQQKNAEGYTASKDLAHWLDQEGVAITPLRPSGTAQISDRLVDVVTEGSFIEKGRRIKVVRVEGTRVVVREVK